MNFLSFEYFQAICQADTIRQAAERLYISPQALSEHLNKLERELDAPLFRRTTPLTLTEAGEAFRQCAQECLDSKKKLETILAGIRAAAAGRVSLGVPTGMPPPLFLPFTAFFRRVHPELELSVTELPSRTGALTDIPAHIDVAMGAFPAGDRLAHLVILESRRFVVAAHRDLLRRVLGRAQAEALDQAAQDDKQVPLSMFRRCPFILKRPGSIIRDHEDRLFQAAGFTPIGPIETGDLDLSIRMTLLEEAAIYLPEPMARAGFLIPEVPGQESPVLLCPVAVEGERWTLTAAHQARRPLSPNVRKLVESARQYYESLLGEGNREVLPDRTVSSE